ncbi:SDR family oxidoreductase [Mucilaginibacter terrenus]|uniref:SDR family oxidoreductase n=1 Tax=Mucilaginibacter terrenus TaxID=2482727 RepID=A0A3E2NTQ0_9SPHI|nr:SDR family oxidoreductase [Mucilaginibacter terrenus]RFZ84386.1 SDR family oxidoreductase [Mucilaginibacter terrenus]
MAFTTTVITGGTSGIGKETALALAKKGHAVYLLVRNMEKGEQVRQQIITHSKNNSVYIVHCDLSDMESVRTAADTLRNSLMAINVLINNAGGIFAQKEITKDGLEMTFAVNHLGHFLLTNALMTQLERGQARIINVSSEGHRLGKPRFNDINWEHTPYSAMKAYGMAKLFNIYFTRSLATKFGPKGISSFALHPGVVSTEFGAGLTGFNKTLMWLASPFMITAEEGAKTTIYLATAQRIDAKSGKYFKKQEVAATSATAADEKARQTLWELSTEMIEPFS